MKKLIFVKLFLLALFSNAFAGEISIHNGWIKAKKGVMTGAYVHIKNTTGVDDKLVGVKTDFAKKNEIHTVKMDSKGNAKMMKVNFIKIPNNHTTKLKRGGNHLMFMGLKKHIMAGKKYNITLVFEKYGEVSIDLIAKKVKMSKHKHKEKQEHNHHN